MKNYTLKIQDKFGLIYNRLHPSNRTAEEFKNWFERRYKIKVIDIHETTMQDRFGEFLN